MTTSAPIRRAHARESSRLAVAMTRTPVSALANWIMIEPTPPAAPSTNRSPRDCSVRPKLAHVEPDVLQRSTVVDRQPGERADCIHHVGQRNSAGIVNPDPALQSEWLCTMNSPHIDQGGTTMTDAFVLGGVRTPFAR